MVEQEEGRNVFSHIDEVQLAIQAQRMQSEELRQKPRKEKPRKSKSKGKPLRRPSSPVQVRGADRVERPPVTTPTVSVRNESLRLRLPGTVAFINESRNPQIRAQLDAVFMEKEVELAMQAMGRYIKNGEVEEHRTELAGTIFSALAFQLVKVREEENVVVLRPSEVKGMLLGQSNVPDGLLLVSSKDGKSTDIVVAHQYINSRHAVPLKRSDTLVDLIRTTSGSIGSARVSGYLHRCYPRLPQVVTVGRQYFSLRYVLPADLEAPRDILEESVDRVPLGTRDLGILTTRVIGDIGNTSYGRPNR